MYNGENEIKCPDDKYIKHYLWSDYFHDSKIKNIQFSNSKGKDDYGPDQIVLTLESIIDIDKDWDKLKGTDDDKRTYIKYNRDKYMYNLYFVDCKYFNYEKSIMANDYINGRFKDTAIVRKINKSTNKYYYHFRIGTDDGYLDIIFSKFKIRKLIGRIYIKDTEIKDYNVNWLKKYDQGALLKKNDELDEIKLKRLLNEGDDIERYNTLYYFMNYTSESIVTYARDIMSLDWEDYEMSKIMAISVIGKQGDKKDLTMLFHEYFDVERRYTLDNICYCSTLLPKRHLMDAIENIIYREDEDYVLIL